MVKVLIKKLNPKVKLPMYKTLGASGMDLMAFLREPIIIKSKTSSLIPTGLSIAFSDNYEMINLSNLPKGSYIIQLINSQSIINHKIILR